ncbi:MAG: hypothetical protein KGJ62_09245 [Armatimonadetes bacterium]|nr:hypothetical protein [Armatimonadota bacterium]MDE2207429.1 hypothetical protein [Armatimonadota bacterium]
MTPFASGRGGAGLVIDDRGTGKRVTLNIPAEGIVARLSLTGPVGDTASED